VPSLVINLLAASLLMTESNDLFRLLSRDAINGPTIQGENMKKIVIRASLALLALFTIAVNATAQSGRLTADVPFAFTLGGQEFAPGRYVIRPLDQGILYITDEEGKAALTFTNRTEGAKRMDTAGSLVFAQYGDRYFLSKVFWPSETSGREIRKSKVETELARNLRAPRRVAVNSR
jgi:hypothetical protein